MRCARVYAPLRVCVCSCACMRVSVCVGVSRFVLVCMRMRCEVVRTWAWHAYECMCAVVRQYVHFVSLHQPGRLPRLARTFRFDGLLCGWTMWWQPLPFFHRWIGAVGGIRRIASRTLYSKALNVATAFQLYVLDALCVQVCSKLIVMTVMSHTIVCEFEFWYLQLLWNCIVHCCEPLYSNAPYCTNLYSILIRRYTANTRGRTLRPYSLIWKLSGKLFEFCREQNGS